MNKAKTLQTRVDEETARRFNAVAMGEGMTPSELLRELVEEKLRSAAAHLDKLQEALVREHEQRMAALAAAAGDSAPKQAKKR